MILQRGRIKLTFKATNTVQFHSILDKCCWKVLRRSLTFDSPSNSRLSRLCKSSCMFRNGNSREVTKQQRLCENIFKRMNSNSSNGGDGGVDGDGGPTGSE